MSNDNATLSSYAQALLELADQRGTTSQVNEDLQGLAQIIEQDRTFATYLADPSVSQSDREKTIDTVFGGRTSELLIAYLKLLNSKDRLGDLPGITSAFTKLLDERSGNVEVEVTVPQAMTPGDLEEVRQRVSAKLGKNAVVKQNVDESLIGGIVLKVGDSLIDGSVKTQLETLKRRLVAAV